MGFLATESRRGTENTPPNKNKKTKKKKTKKVNREKQGRLFLRVSKFIMLRLLQARNWTICNHCNTDLALLT